MKAGLITTPLLWLVMTIQRRAWLIITVLGVFYFAPKFELLFHGIAGSILNPLLSRLPSNEAKDSALKMWAWILGLALLPFKLTRAVGWSIIGWKIVDSFKKES